MPEIAPIEPKPSSPTEARPPSAKKALSRTRPLPKATRRYVKSWLAATRYRLSHARGPQAEENVHAYRVGIKRLRSFLRLMQGALTDGQYRRANATLRDAGRALSATRNAAVVGQCADALIASAPPGAERAEAQRQLQPLASAAVAPPLAASELKTLLDALNGFERHADAWTRQCNSMRIPRRGFLRSYARARRMMFASAADPQPHTLHEWRKSTKHHLYQLQTLKAWLPESFKHRQHQAKELAEALGALNDLSLLDAALKGPTECLTAPPKGSRTVSDGHAPRPLIDTRRGQLQLAAFRLGASLYADSAKSMKRRLKKHLRKPAQRRDRCCAH